MQSFKECKRLIAADFARLDNLHYGGGYIRYLITNHSFKATFWYRLSQCLKDRESYAARLLYGMVRCIMKHESWKTGIQISIRSYIGGGLTFPHFGCIIIGDAVIGDGCKIYQGVTIGYSDGKHPGFPTIGNNVTICCGATVVGNIHIGDNAVIGAGAVVIDDVPSNATAVGVPAKCIISKKKNKV